MNPLKVMPLVVSALVLNPAYAQTDSTKDRDVVSASIEEVVVSAQYLYSDTINALKTPTPILNVPQSLSIVSAKDIRARGFNSISEVVNYLPGVTTSQGEGHRDAVIFRGVRSTADFYIDGMRDDVQYYRPLYNLAQVEVLRGPNALLFGRGGTGGVLNRVTKKAQLDQGFTTSQLSVDSLGELGGQIDHNRVISDSVALRINAMVERLGNHRDFYDGDRVGVNPTLHIESGDSVIDLSYEYIDHQRFIDRGIPTGADGRPVEAFEKIVFGDPDVNTTALKAHLWRASVQHSFSDTLKGNIAAFYGDYDKLYQNFYAAAYDQAQTPDEVTLDGYVDTTQRKNSILSANLVGESEFAGMQHTLLAGVEFIDTSSDQDRWNTFWDTTDDDKETFSLTRNLGLEGGVGLNALGNVATNSFDRDINDDTDVSIDVTSVYLQDELKLTDYLQVVVGLRYDSFDIKVFNALADETRSRNDSEVSPRFGVVYKPKDAISIYASYSESFLPRSGEQFANINGSNDELAPNTFGNREVGVKYDFASGLSFTAALFEIEQRSPQVADNDPATLDVIESEIDGFELQLQGRVNALWSVSAGYSSLDGEQVNRQGRTGLTPRELPDSMFSIWNQFTLSDDLSLGLGLTHQSESFINNSNSAILPSYTRIDASARYRLSESTVIQLNVENATDELYFPNAHSTHQVSVGAPINVRLAINTTF
ncbi:TonB-dependent siderophore receptor [Luminiphilus sp.]|nr:TonB-dependent siderophore receptor [Luminiphilus sp.]